jgi:uncharacterized membrane protein HdeD (DUF308 family)
MPVYLASNWWALVLRGAAAILFGIVALAFPPSAVTVLVLLFGVYALVDGVFNLVAALRNRGGESHWGALLFEGIVGIVCGLVAFFWPGLTAVALTLLIGVWSLLTGALEIAAAVKLRKILEHEWLLGFSGVLSVVFGIILFVWPGAGMVVIAMWIGAYAIVFGALLVALGIKLRSWARSLQGETPTHAIPRHA